MTRSEISHCAWYCTRHQNNVGDDPDKEQDLDEDLDDADD